MVIYGIVNLSFAAVIKCFIGIDHQMLRSASIANIRFRCIILGNTKSSLNLVYSTFDDALSESFKRINH